VVGRIIANQLGQKLGKQVFVDNRPGAGGVVGSDLAAKADPDGYTLLIISIAHAVDPWLYKTPYDPVKDFAPVSIIATGTNVLTVNPSVPVHSVKELARPRQGEIRRTELCLRRHRQLSASERRTVQAHGGREYPARALQGRRSGHARGDRRRRPGDVLLHRPDGAEHPESGQLRALATGGEKRSPILPDLPTIAEAGVPGYVATNWWGIVAPAGTPQPVVDKLHDTIAGLLDSADTKKFLDNEGAAPAHMSSAEFGKFIEAEIAKWGPVVKQAGMKAE
jgi:tripartite-type tricarboxylate transporter receptor subunit TctC